MDTSAEIAFHRLRIRQLELICVLSETASIRGAAERLHASPPALSKSLREVERVVGMPLFFRSPQGMQTTPAGDAFVEHARAILQRVPALRESVRETGVPVPRDILHIGTAPYLAWQLLAPALEAMAAAGPIPRFQFVESSIMTLAEQLVHGELDAILSLLTPEALEVLSRESLVLEQVLVEKLIIVGAPGERPVRTGWKQLADRRWILPPTTYSVRKLVQRAFLQSGLLPPEPFFESHNIPATLALARRGLGIAAAFGSTVRNALAEGSLSRIHVENELESISIGIAYRKRAADVAAIRSLREALRQTARQLTG
jgi:DNA-binding transcriptional LysR family regulator